MPAQTSPRSPGSRPTDDHLLDAACAEFAETGFHATSLSSVANRANSTKPTLYAHFGSKEALYEALLQREAKTCRAWLFDAYESGAALGMRDQVSNDMRAFFEYAAKHPNGFRLLFSGDHTGIVVEVRQELVAAIVEQVARRLGDFNAAHAPIPHAVERQLAVMAVGVALDTAEHAVADPRGDLDAACEIATAFVTAGLRNFGAELTH